MDPARQTIRRMLNEAEEPEGIEGYPEAGLNPETQIEVQEALRRWATMPPEERGDIPLLYWLLGSGTPPYKMSREESEYTDQSTVEGQTCANCEFAYKKVVRDQFICSQIRDDIQPKGWCKLWKPADV